MWEMWAHAPQEDYMPAPLCKLCKEQVWNFICIDCLAKGAVKMLLPEYVPDFLEFHRSLSRYFSSGNSEMPCIICKKPNPAVICIYCYTQEVRDFVMNEKPELSDLLRAFRMKFQKEGMPDNNFMPVFEEDNLKRIPGICDECGEYSNGLIQLEGEWVCPECGEHIEE